MVASSREQNVLGKRSSSFEGWKDPVGQLCLAIMTIDIVIGVMENRPGMESLIWGTS